MTSLQNLSCTTTPATSSHHPRSSSSRPIFPKQSHFITHAKRIHRLQVSCQNQNESSGQGKLDRRNRLLGLGGLYGAANLISAPNSSAAPIGAPELDSCHLGQNWNTGQPLSEPCCLSSISEVVDYKLPPRLPYRIRRPAHLLTRNEIADYNEAIRRMKNLPASHPHSFVQQSRIHCAYCNASYYQAETDKVDLQVHHNWLFFPFHRWYIYFFEKILGKLINKPSFTLPYWNWDHPEGMPVPPVFLDRNSSLYDPIRDPENTDLNPTKPVYLGGDPNASPEQMIQNNIAQVYSEMMTNRSKATEFMGVEYRRGDPWSNAGEGASETGSHNSVHWWIGTKPSNAGGENLGNFYSAGRDPLFYCHHSNVDRMWALWLGIPTTGMNKNIDDRDFLDTQFIFYDENERLVRVKVEDCVGDTRKMGYVFEHRDTPWQDYVPPTQTAEARTKRANIAAGKEKAENVFPLAVLDKTVTILVSKSKKGKADEYLVIENITYDTTKFVKFDVFVNDEDNDANNLQKASFAGTFSQVPSKSANKTATSAIRLRLTDLYEFMDVADDDTVLVTLVPRHEGPGISIGGIKIVENSTN